MTTHWGLPSPNLVVSVVGGEGHEKIKTWVRDVLRNGLVRAAQSTGKSPFLTTGLVESVENATWSSWLEDIKIVWITVFTKLLVLKKLTSCVPPQYLFYLFCPGAWILTGGLREGVSRCVGEAVRDHGAAAPALSEKKVIAVGLAPWGMVHNRQQLVNPQVHQELV